MAGPGCPVSAGPGVQFGTGTTVKDLHWYEEWLGVAEPAGFDLLTVGDSQSLWADPFVCMAVAARETTLPRIALTVSNPRTRHPAVVASSLVALQQLSEGRICFGFSSGDSALRNIGLRPARLSEMEAFGRAVTARSAPGIRSTTTATTSSSGGGTGPPRCGWRPKGRAPSTWPVRSPTV